MHLNNFCIQLIKASWLKKKHFILWCSQKYLAAGPPRTIILDGARDIFGPFTHNSNILNHYCMLLLNQSWFNSTLVFEIGNCSQ